MGLGRRLRDEAVLRLHAAKIDLGNFQMVHYRRVDGFLITAKNSGTHWLRFMLSHALAAHYALPPPACSSGPDSDDFIGHPRRPGKHPGVPRIGSTHHQPSSACGWGWLRRLLRLPPVVVLVRDPKDALLSHFYKWRERHGLTLSEFIRLPPAGSRHGLADVWWYVDFFNRWGRIAARRPRDVMIVRYEDVAANPGVWLRRIADFWNVELPSEAVRAGLAVNDREALRSRLDPAHGEVIVPEAAARAEVALSQDDETWLRAVLADHLRHDFGYGYLRPEPGRRSAPSRDPAPSAETA